ncbi:MAG: S9 family peptidase [Pyrinomonadaceae bacterium]
MFFRKIIFLIIILSAVSFLADAQATWSPEMQIKVKAIGSPRVSPDTTRIVYTVSNEVLTADKSEYVSQIWLASTDGNDNMQLTFADKSSTNPKLSPDGKWIAFLSTRKDNKSNLYLLRVGGGEAEALTDVKSNITDFEWSPDGKWIAYAMTDAKSDDEEKNDKGKNDFRWVDENIKMARLYVMPVQKDAAGKHETRKLTENYSVSAFNWSPDGSKIVFSHVKDPRADFWMTSDVSTVDVASGKVTGFVNTAAAETSPVYSPDGKWIAMVVSDNPPRWAQSGNINIFPASGGTPKIMPVSHDGQPNIVGWSPDSGEIVLSEAKGTGTSIYKANATDGTIKEIKYSNSVISAISMARDGSAYSFVIQSSSKPPEAGIIKTGSETTTRISYANSESEKMPVGKTVLIKWKSKDGREIEGLLTYPNGYVAGTKVPFILNIHGGPAGVFNQSYIGGRGVYPLATFASRGYAILRANPRGSSGYGTEFRRANFKDWGGMDYQDLMTGVDKVIEMGVADPNRMGVMGWSYGGYMTSWIVTQTKRFKAASAGAPVTNLMSFNGTADIPAFVPDYFGGQSWEIPEVYVKHSAMFNIKGVSTPTLIQQGDADVRVPISQGYEFYNALKLQGVPTKMLVLPRQPHGPTEPKMQIAAMQANLDWFEKYLK